MVIDWLSKAKGVGVGDLIARRKHAKAIEALRAEIEAGSRSSQMRMQLADLLVLAGRGKEAAPILLGLADEFARDGFAAKAIAVLKKIQKLEPGRSDVDVQLARLINEKRTDSTPRAAGSSLEIGIDVIPASAPSQPASAAPEAGTLPPPEPEGMAARPEPAAEPAPSAEAEPLLELEPLPEGEAPQPSESSPEMLGQDLIEVLEELLHQSHADAPAAQEGPVAASPLFSDFSQDELVAVMRGLELLSFEPGDIIIGEGEPGDSLFVLTSGVAKAFVRNAQGRHVLVREMTEGAFFGEISILTGSPRTATVTARTRCELLELDRATLDSITRTHPRVREVLTHFCEQRTRSEPKAPS